MTDAERLEATLDSVSRSILRAEYGEIPKFLEEAERLILQLAPFLTAEAAQRIHIKAHHNGLCLKAAARGLRAAQRRFDEVTAAGNKLFTYTIRGQRSEIGTDPTAMARRL